MDILSRLISQNAVVACERLKYFKIINVLKRFRYYHKIITNVCKLSCNEIKDLCLSYYILGFVGTNK